MDLFNDLSFPFIMDLFRTKASAEIRGDTSAIENLKFHYPDLFSEEFKEFIEKLRVTVTYLDQKYDENFSSILEPKETHAVRDMH